MCNVTIPRSKKPDCFPQVLGMTFQTPTTPSRMCQPQGQQMIISHLYIVNFCSPLNQNLNHPIHCCQEVVVGYADGWQDAVHDALDKLGPMCDIIDFQGCKVGHIGGNIMGKLANNKFPLTIRPSSLRTSEVPQNTPMPNLQKTVLDTPSPMPLPSLLVTPSPRGRDTI